MFGAFVPIPDDDQPVPHRSGLIHICPQAYDRAVPIRIIFNGNRSHAIPAGLTFLETPGHGLKWEKRSPQRWEPNPPRSLAIYDRVCHAIQVIQNPIRIPRPLSIPPNLNGAAPVGNLSESDATDRRSHTATSSA